jgi:hypothetical protein
MSFPSATQTGNNGKEDTQRPVNTYCDSFYIGQRFDLLGSDHPVGVRETARGPRRRIALLLLALTEGGVTCLRPDRGVTAKSWLLDESGLRRCP